MELDYNNNAHCIVSSDNTSTCDQAEFVVPSPKQCEPPRVFFKAEKLTCGRVEHYDIVLLQNFSVLITSLSGKCVRD